MNKLLYLCTVILLLTSQIVSAETFIPDLDIKGIEVKDDDFIFVSFASFDTGDESCYAFPDEKGHPQVLLMYSHSGATANAITHKDAFKMMWTQLNTALALNRPVAVSIASTSGFCLVRSVKMTDGQ